MIKFLTAIIVLFVFVYVAIFLSGTIVLSKAFEEVLGVPTKAGSLHLGFLSSRIGIYDLRISNPSGFEEKPLASIPEIFVHYNLKALLKKEIHIKEFRLNLDQITIERSPDGKINLAELKPLKSQAKAPQKKPKSPDDVPAQASEAFDLKIDTVVLSLGRARYVDNTRGKPQAREFSLEINNLVLEDVTDPNEIVQQIVLRTMQKVGLNALVPNIDQLTSAVKIQADSKIAEAKENVTNFIKGLQLPFGGESAKAN